MSAARASSIFGTATAFTCASTVETGRTGDAVVHALSSTTGQVQTSSVFEPIDPDVIGTSASSVAAFLGHFTGTAEASTPGGGIANGFATATATWFDQMHVSYDLYPFLG